jgi:phage tail sheath gpL-like
MALIFASTIWDQGEVTPAGLTLTVTAMTGGAGAPDFVDALGNLQDKTFDFIINAYDDTASLDAMKAFLNDASGRWAWDKQLYGHSSARLREPTLSWAQKARPEITSMKRCWASIALRHHVISGLPR